MIDSLYTQAAINVSDPRPKINVHRDLQYFLLGQESKIQVIYYNTKQDPKVMLDNEEEENPPNDEPQDITVDDFVGLFWHPNKLCVEYMVNFEVVNKGEVNKQRVIKGTAVPNKYSKHTTNHVAHVHYHKSRCPMMLSEYPDVAIPEDQIGRLNP